MNIDQAALSPNNSMRAVIQKLDQAQRQALANLIEVSKRSVIAESAPLASISNSRVDILA